MSKNQIRVSRAATFSFAAVALAVATIMVPASQPLFAASAAKHAAIHARAMHARAQAPAEAPSSVICVKSGCMVTPPDCRGVPAPGVEPGYQMLVCP